MSPAPAARQGGATLSRQFLGTTLALTSCLRHLAVLSVFTLPRLAATLGYTFRAKVRGEVEQFPAGRQFAAGAERQFPVGRKLAGGGSRFHPQVRRKCRSRPT